LEEVQEQQLTFKDYLNILRRGTWVIIVCFILVMAATIYYTLTMQPVYEASGLILIKEEGGVRSQIFDVTNFMKKETMINNHVEILKSYTLAEDVIKRLEASQHADSLYVLGRGKNGQRFSFSPVKWILSFFPQKKSPSDALPTTEDFADEFRENMISVVPRRDTDLLEMKVQANSAFEAQFIANTWMEAYQAMDISESRGEVQEVKSFLEEQLTNIKDELTNSEESLKNYQKDKKVTELTSETTQMIQQSAQFESLYQEARTELEANMKRLNHLRSQLTESQKEMLKETSFSSPLIEELSKQLAIMTADKASYEQQLKGAGINPKTDSKYITLVQRIEGTQNSIQSEMKKLAAAGGEAINPLGISQDLFGKIIEIEAENKSLQAKTEELRKISRKFEENLNTLPEKGLMLARLQRDTEVKRNIFMMLTEKYEENRIAEAGQIGSVRIVDRAKTPKFPIKPKKKMNMLLGMMIGLGLGIGITFLKEYLDTSLKTIEDTERLGFTVLGSIPFITAQKTEKTNGRNGELVRIESRLVTHFAPKSPISEAYRTIRTNIQFAQADKSVKTVLVTSSGPGEGKSTSVANLAITFAQMGANTLLIDADLRRPVLHGIFGQSRNEGLTNILVGRLTPEEGIRPTRIENLSLLTSGTLPPNPSELLNSHMMQRFLDDAAKKYDIVLIDTPPVIAVTDAAVLSTLVDGVVVVVLSGKTEKDTVLRSRDLLEKVNARMLGVLVNGVNVSMLYGSYYHYYQDYYSHEAKETKSGRKKVERV
jgi:tyrosine-protein kinase Etk/Wzc